MTTKTLRKIVHIDEEKCNGCGVCVPTCVEGALRIIDGKARLISEKYCDGLGACLGECPQDAITVEERYSEDFDEEAVKHLHEMEESLHSGCPGAAVSQFHDAASEPLPCGCPSASVQQFEEKTEPEAKAAHLESRLAHWPIQLRLVPPGAPFLKNADVLLAADCAPFAYASFHEDFLSRHAVLIACPKLDDFEAHVQKLAQILQVSGLKSLTVVHMEVPCCFGLVHMAKEAIRLSGKNIPFQEVTLGVKGDLKE